MNGSDREEYAKTAARERNRRLGDFFGEGLRKVALEPGRRIFLQLLCKITVSVSRLIPVNGSEADRISASQSDK